MQRTDLDSHPSTTNDAGVSPLTKVVGITLVSGFAVMIALALIGADWAAIPLDEIESPNQGGRTGREIGGAPWPVDHPFPSGVIAAAIVLIVGLVALWITRQSRSRGERPAEGIAPPTDTR